MLDKLKSRKAPLSLSSVSNAIRNSGSSSISPELVAKHLKVVAGDQLGLPPDSVAAVAFDPVQSLLALSTTRNSVHVYGQNSVEVVFELQTSSRIAHLRFVKGVYLVCVEPSGNVTVLSLHSKQILATYSVPGSVTAVESDPSLDWLLLGLSNGSVLFYDVDRFHLTPLRIDNLQKSVLPKQRLSPALHIEWHPRDIGTILVTYTHCAVQYSLTSGAIKNAFVYQLTPDCAGFEFSNNFETGGKKKLFGSSKDVVPRMKEAHYHPNGLHVLTVHEDGSLVFFDANDGTLLQSRTTKHVNLHRPGPPVNPEPCRDLRVKWVTGQDPELTQVLITGSSDANPAIIEVLDLGVTLKYSLTSHEKQSEFYAKPTDGQRQVPVKFNRRTHDKGASESIIQMLPLAADGHPYFSGGHNSSYLLSVTNLGALYLTKIKPAAPPISVPPSLGYIMPPSTFSTIQLVKRIEWYGVASSRKSGPSSYVPLVSGGAPANRHFPRTLGVEDGFNNVLVSGHEDGTIRCVDVTAGDHSDERQDIEFNLKQTLNDGVNSSSYRVTYASFSFDCKFALIGLANGNAAICKFSKVPANLPESSVPTGYSNCRTLHANGEAALVDTTQRLAGDFSSPSFIPTALLTLPGDNKISCLKMCHAGFGAVGYKSGRLIVCDIARGPAVILNLDSVTKHLPSVTGECYVTAIEFAIMEYGQDGYTSLLMFVGTNGGGNFLTFKIIPQSNGAFEAVFADKTLGLNYKSADQKNQSGLDNIIPINASTGESAVATLEMFQRLSQNILVPGLVVVSSEKDLRVLKTPKQKLAHKVIDENSLCSGVITFRRKGAVLATVTRSGFIKLFSLPALSDIADVKIPTDTFNRMKKSSEGTTSTSSSILSSGEIFLKLSSSEILNLFLYDESTNKSFKQKPTDVLFNETAIIPLRPTAGAMSWAKGQTTYISSTDLADLIAGPNRKPAKHLESNLSFNISPEANPNQSYGAYTGGSQGRNERENAYAEPVRKSGASNPYAFGTQRFVRGIRDGLDAVEESINGYANGMSEAMTESVDSSKNAMYKSAFKSKFGF